MAESAECLEEFDRGNAFLATGEFEQAVECYRQSVALDPKFFDGWHALGMGLMKIGELKEAIGCGLQATVLRPNDLLAWTALSQMYMLNKQIVEAEDAKGRARILGLGGKLVKEEPSSPEQ